MYTRPFDSDILQKSVIAVPPLARDASLKLVEAENRALIGHIEGGGVSTLLYGGNANLYHCRVSEYASLLSLLEDAAGEETWVIPSVGPTFGQMMDQARILAKSAFPTAMILPMNGLTTSDGIVEGVKRFVDTFGRSAVIYVKEANSIHPEGIAALFEGGFASFLKYAVPREDRLKDPYLAQIVTLVDPKYIVSGIGEQPAIDHMRASSTAAASSGVS